MNKYEIMVLASAEKLKKALKHLSYCYDKILVPNQPVAKMSEEELLMWEGLSARFSRVADLFLMQYIRSKVLYEDPGFEGTLRDYLNKAEKMELIDDTSDWMKIRELRNKTAHEYNEEHLGEFFALLYSYTPKLLDLKRVLKK